MVLTVSHVPNSLDSGTGILPGVKDKGAFCACALPMGEGESGGFFSWLKGANTTLSNCQRRRERVSVMNFPGKGGTGVPRS